MTIYSESAKVEWTQSNTRNTKAIYALENQGYYSFSMLLNIVASSLLQHNPHPSPHTLPGCLASYIASYIENVPIDSGV